MEEREQGLPAVRDWLCSAPLMRSIWDGLGRPAGSPGAWADQLLQELAAAGVVGLRDGVVHDR
jgi:hypothetical protein